MRLNFRPAGGASSTVFCRPGAFNRRVYFHPFLRPVPLSFLRRGCRTLLAGCWHPRQPSELMPPGPLPYIFAGPLRVSHSHAQVAETAHGPKAETAHGPKLQRQHTAPRRRRRRRRNGIMCCPDRNGAAVIALATGVATANDLPSAGCVCMCGSAFTSEWCSRRRAGHNFGLFFEQLRVWTGRSMARY